MNRESDIKELCAEGMNNVENLAGVVALVKGIKETAFKDWIFMVSETGWEVLYPEDKQHFKQDYEPFGGTMSDRLAYAIENTFKWQEAFIAIGGDLSGRVSA